MFPSLAAISEAQRDQLYEVFPLWVVGKGEEGNPLTPLQVRAGIRHRNTGQRRTQERGTKAFTEGSWKGQAGTEYMNSVGRQRYQAPENAAGEKTKKHSRTWW